MKINFNCLKLTKNITKKNMISNVSKQMIKKNTNDKVLPLVTFPLVAYYIGDSRDKALERLIKKMEDAGVDIPSNYKPNPNTNSGLDFVSQGKFRSAIDDAAKNGTIDSSEKQDLLHSVAFTGKDDSILASDPELARDLRELQSKDTSLSPELQEYRDLPDFDNPRELLEYFIGDELPDDVILDWDLWSVLETMWEELLDIGDWL